MLASRKADGGNDGKYSAAAAVEQKKAYPDIAPLKSALASAEAFKRAADTAAVLPGWRVVATDAGAGRIEASQASRWFGFTDDIVIRVTADGTAAASTFARQAATAGVTSASTPLACAAI